MPTSDAFKPSRRHADLGPDFFDVVAPADFPQHVLRFRNQRHAATVGLDTLDDAEWIAHFGRFAPLPGSFEEPLALRYHGHQFRSYNPYLGDGRGFLFAQMVDTSGRLLDLGTKGSGQTPWSRQGDGRLTLKGGVREVLATEMLEALGVNTSKSFSLIETGESLHRNDEPSPTRASVLVRLSHSHIRIGTFQRFLFLKQPDRLQALVDHSIRTYYHDTWHDMAEVRAARFFDAVSANVARLGADWMAAGFVHGVLNTDNINITGESFDYGPWRFLPVLDPDFTAAYFDQTGLYAFGQQPTTLIWNLARLADCLLLLTDQTALEDVLTMFQARFHAAFTAAILRRLGLVSKGQEEDTRLANALWRFLVVSRAPFEQVLFDWHGGLARARKALSGPAAADYAGPEFDIFREALGEFDISPTARLDHPYFARAVPVTMLIDEVEAIWAPIAESDDWSAFERKIADIRLMGEAYGIVVPSQA